MPYEQNTAKLVSHKWDKRFLRLAKEIAKWSKDPSTQVGAVIVRPNRTICSVGYNGFPRGVGDDPKRYQDRELKYQMVVHADMNAILSSKDASLEGYTLYVVPYAPCPTCAGAIIQSGITRIVVPYSTAMPKRLQTSSWRDHVEVALKMFNEAGVEVNYVS